MLLFFDTEFTGLHKDTTLISLGIISENGKTFYAELTDYDKSQCNEWIIENVINNTRYLKDNPEESFLIHNNNNHGNTICCGNKDVIRGCLLSWLKQFNEVQFVADVAHYDFVLLIDLLADSALSLPNKISASCHDINQDIATKFGLDEVDAFNINREKIALNYGIEFDSKDKHNALHDAKVCKVIYEGMQK